MPAMYMHVHEVGVNHLTYYDSSCYKPTMHAMKYYVATLHTEVDTVHLKHVSS
jgi:hypothetical protein